MEDWFGVTRQTISRNIDRLVEKGFVLKECKQDLINPIIKHNSYMVNIPNVTDLCENADKDSYQNFLDSYRSLLKQKFPEDDTKIDDYLNELMTWHENKNLEVCVKLNDLASLIYRTSEDNKPITDVLESVRKTNKKLKASPEKSYIDKSGADVLNPKQKKSVSDDGQTELFSTKPKRKSKKAIRAEWDADKRAMNTDFVYIRIGGNEKLLELLNKFLDTDNGQSYTPNQWEEQLETLYTYGRTPERMIEGVRISYMNNYRQLYIVDKSEVDMDKKLNAIDKYVEEFADNNDELRSLLCSYVTEVPKGKSFTESQFKLQLKTLTSLCKTTEDKIIGKPCVLLIGQNKPVIKCIHIETDDLTIVNSRFDLENVKQIIEKRGINKDFYGLPDTPSENVRVKRERIGVRGNWDWIKNGKPRPWRKEQ